VANHFQSEFEFAESRSILGRLPFAAALWSPDRRRCAFNDSVSRLLGFCESDFEKQSSLWMERIHPQDRDAFAVAWRQIQSGDHDHAACHYRFLPRHQPTQIRVGEFLFSNPHQPDESRAVWSLYTEEPNFEEEILESVQVCDLVHGLNHEIGNSLQAIKGEIDLLLLAGALPAQNANGISRGIERISELTSELNDYLAPVAFDPKREDPATAVRQVLDANAERLNERGIRITLDIEDPLPALPLGADFQQAFKRLIDLSLVLLPKGGDLHIEGRLRRVRESRFLDFQVVHTSPSGLAVEETEIFRPYLKINQHRIGLTMVIARQLLRRHFGKIIFHKEQRNRGVFSISIKIPSDRAGFE
jgi:signal transduction histidine kinase